MLDGGRSSLSTASVCTYSQKGIKTTVRVVIHLETSCGLMGPSCASSTLCYGYGPQQMCAAWQTGAQVPVSVRMSAHGTKNTETSPNTQWLTTVTHINVAALRYYIHHNQHLIMLIYFFLMLMWNVLPRSTGRKMQPCQNSVWPKLLQNSPFQETLGLCFISWNQIKLSNKHKPKMLWGGAAHCGRFHWISLIYFFPTVSI